MSGSCSIKLTLSLTHKRTHSVGTKPNLMIFISMKTQDKQNATRSQWPRSQLIIITRFLDDSLNRSATCSASYITLCILFFFFSYDDVVRHVFAGAVAGQLSLPWQPSVLSPLARSCPHAPGGAGTPVLLRQPAAGQVGAASDSENNTCINVATTLTLTPTSVLNGFL